MVGTLGLNIHPLVGQSDSKMHMYRSKEKVLVLFPCTGAGCAANERDDMVSVFSIFLQLNKLFYEKLLSTMPGS